MRLYAIVAAAITVAVAAILAALGWLAKSDWSTFFPDLVVGFAGAGFISTVIALVQLRATEAADRRAEQTAAYLELLNALSGVREFRPNKDEAGLLARTTTSMILFAETVDHDYPSIPAWFEAERQLLLHYCGLALEGWPAEGEQASFEDQMKALEPVLKWTKEFSSNVRLWRRNKLSDRDASEQAANIEKLLRTRNAWRPHPE